MISDAALTLERCRSLLDPSGNSSVEVPGGFAWWGSDFRTEAVVYSIPDHPPIFRIGSDMWKGFDGSDKDLSILDSVLKGGTLSAPARLRTDPTRLGLWMDIPMDLEKGSWMAGFLSLIIAQQNSEAARFGRLGRSWKADSSGPTLGKDSATSPFSEIEAELLSCLGRRSSFFRSDIELMAEQLEGESLLNIRAGNHGISAEVPLGCRTGLIRFLCGQPHPRLGNGLFCFLTIPIEADPSLAMRMNELGLGQEHPSYGPGSWCVGEVGLTHFIFYPNAIYRRGLSSWAVDWSVQRSKWIRDVILGQVWGNSLASTGGRHLPLYQSLIEIYRGERAVP